MQKFKNDRSLTDEQIDTIVKWVDAGAPQGDPKDMPAAEHWPEDQGWNFAAMFGQKEPDLIIKSHDFTMPARVAGRVGQARHAIGHHRAALGARDRDSARRRQGPQDHASRDRLPRAGPSPARRPRGGLPAPFMEWAVGKQGEMMRPDTGKLLLPGSKFRWDIHYSQAGEEITNKVEMGIYFYPKGQEPKFRNTLSLVPAALGTLDIRPNTLSLVGRLHRAARERPHRELPAAHAPARQGDDGRSDLCRPARSRCISLVSDFNFNWMTTYVYADDVAPLLPKGTMLKVTAWHDNTAAKKSNPDPNQWVGWGDRTVDEMAHAWINIVYMKDDDFKAEQEKRRAAPTTASAPQQQH